MPSRGDFVGGDQAYLRDVQYGSTANLDARSRLHARSSMAAEPWLAWLARRVTWPSNGTVVEFGCGTGSLWAEAAADWPPGRYLVSDQSDAMVRRALDRSATRLADARGVVADVQSAPIPSGVADVVVANHMLYHVPDIPRAIGELRRVLHPDGVALVSTNGADHMAELAPLLEMVFGPTETLTDVSRFGRESGGELLQASFAEVDWVGFDDHLLCTDPCDVLDYLTSFPPGEQASRIEHDALRAAVDAAFAAAAGTLRISKDTGAFVARRPR